MAFTHKLGTTIAGHAIEVEFDGRLVVVNRARLHVDGEKLDSAALVYGQEDLHATLADGTDVSIRFHSGMVGEITRAQVKRPDGAWEDLTEVAPSKDA